MKQLRLEKKRESKKRKRSEETDNERQHRLEKDRVYQKQKYAKRRPQPINEINQQDYLKLFIIIV